MKQKLLRLIPYAMALAVGFYALPLLPIQPALLVLLVLPALVFVCSVVYGIRQGFDGWLSVITAVLFASTLFVFYNESAWIYIIIYAVTSLVGCGIGRLFHKTASKAVME